MIIGNWKSNMLKKTLWCQDFENEFKPLGFDHKPNPQSWLNCRMGVAVPTIDVLDMQKVCDHYFGDWYKRDDVYELIFDIGVQDVDHSSGSRTGAISVDMISEYLCYCGKSLNKSQSQHMISDIVDTVYLTTALVKIVLSNLLWSDLDAANELDYLTNLSPETRSHLIRCD